MKVLQDALAEGTIRGYGQTLLWVYLRRHYIRVRFNNMKSVLQELNPINVRHRKPEMQSNARREYIC
jgi:hypothetical protein